MVLVPSSVTALISASTPSLKDVVSSCVFDVDATIAASYGGSGQTWANLVTAPADGSAQAAYDFYLGAGSGGSSDDPTFTGTSGNAAAYFSLDGGDYFTLKSASNTSFLNNLHKTTGGQDFWIAAAFQLADASAAWPVMGTNPTTNDEGIRVHVSSGEAVTLRQRGSGSVECASINLSSGTNYTCLYSYSHGSGTVRYWINTVTATSESFSFSTSTSNPAGALSLFAANGGTNFAGTGTRVYAAAMGNAYIGNTEAAAIFAAYESRHGRDYTP